MDILSRSRRQDASGLRCDIVIVSITLHFLPPSASRLRATLKKLWHRLHQRSGRFRPLIITLLSLLHRLDQKPEGFAVELIDSEDGDLAGVKHLGAQPQIQLKRRKDQKQLNLHQREDRLEENLRREVLPIVQPLRVPRVNQSRPNRRIRHKQKPNNARCADEGPLLGVQIELEVAEEARGKEEEGGNDDEEQGLHPFVDVGEFVQRAQVHLIKAPVEREDKVGGEV